MKDAFKTGFGFMLGAVCAMTAIEFFNKVLNPKNEETNESSEKEESKEEEA